ncbi:dense granule protein GRA11, putative, partial [Eimeria acervulina]
MTTTLASEARVQHSLKSASCWNAVPYPWFILPPKRKGRGQVGCSSTFRQQRSRGPGISLVAEVRSQSYETFESTTTYHDAQQDTTAAVTGSIDSESYSLSHTEEGYIGQLSAEDDSDRPDWRRMLRNRGQCDSTTSNTFTVSEQAGVAGKAMEGEYEMEGYKQGEGNAARTNANDNSSFPPPSVPHDPTRRKIFPNQGVSYDSESTMRRYLDTEDADAEAMEDQQVGESAVDRALGKKKKATYVAAPMKAPAPIVMAAPTKKAAPMFVEPAPMIIEAAPTKKGRYLAAVDEPEGQQETEQFEQHDTTGERSLGKKKKVAYVAEPMKVAPPPMKFAPPAPAPMVMAAPTKMAPAPLFVEAAPPMKGRYLAAEDEPEVQLETENFETEQYDTA